MKNKCSLCKKLLVKKSGNQKFCLPQCSYQAKKIFRIFEIIKQRCRNGYCGGVKVYKGWVKNKNTFLLWAIKSGWHEGLEIDRKNNQEGYFPKNCRFVTKSENCRNRRSGSTDWISMKRKCNLWTFIPLTYVKTLNSCGVNI